jgi:hypothetical protein
VTAILQWVGGVLGSLTVLALVEAGLFWLAKESLSKAISLAADRELVRLKSALDAELQEKALAFQATLERDRKAAGEAIEFLKAQLTLEAEVRKQAGVVKVDLLVRIWAATNTVTDDYVNLVDNQQRITALHVWWLTAREAGLFVTQTTLDALERYSGQLSVANGQLWPAPTGGTPGRLKAEEAIYAARVELLAALRGELPPELQVATLRLPVESK